MKRISANNAQRALLQRPGFEKGSVRITLLVTLAILAVAVGAFSQSLTEPANTQSSRSVQPTSGDDGSGAETNSSKTMSATCFCKVSANGTEVAKPTKGGYVQPFQAEACRNYCRGLWDSSPSQRITWAKLLPNACGDVSMTMDAALGTMGYQQVRSEIEHGINGTHVVNIYSCPVGQQLSVSTAYPKQCIVPAVLYSNATVPDQLLAGGFLWQNHNFYQTSGPAPFVKTCQ